MSERAFAEAMRRVITGDGENGRSLIVIDGPPSGQIGAPGLGGLYEIWHEALGEALDPKNGRERGEAKSMLSPDNGKVKVRWFVIEPPPEGVPREAINAAARARLCRVRRSRASARPGSPSSHAPDRYARHHLPHLRRGFAGAG